MANLTTKDLAKKFNIAERVARRWCERGYFKNAEKVQTPRGDYWEVPEMDLKDFTPPKAGRPRINNPTPAALAKRKLRDKG